MFLSKKRCKLSQNHAIITIFVTKGWLMFRFYAIDLFAKAPKSNRLAFDYRMPIVTIFFINHINSHLYEHKKVNFFSR